VGKIVYADHRQLVTVVCCFTATGTYVVTAKKFPRKRMCHELCSEAVVGTLPLTSDTHHVKATETDPVLLVLDNHIFHCKLEAIMFCRDNHITLLSISPHGSQKIQPLGCGILGP
jgi:hypothetical protein